jgi:hypothetical protein
MAWAAVAFCCASVQAEETIETTLDSVRGDSGGGPTEQPPPPPCPPPRRESATEPSVESDDGGFFGLLVLGGFCVTSPIWAPIGALGDNYTEPACFPRFPYDNIAGHLTESPPTALERFWSGRFNVGYLEPFTDVNGVSGRLLLSTSSRFGLDAEATYFDEHGPHASPDRLWIGDCNLVFRFAQAERAEFRTGVGFNWLDCPDPSRRQADFGFNFTYGADLFPRKPWILSADLDAGNLGKAGLFRFRTTGGIMLHGVELYTGYEHLDIGRTHLNLLLAGVRAWF